jgi:hypothetical protein
MNRFLKYSSLFLLFGVILFHVKPFYLLYGERYKLTVAGHEIYYSLKKSKAKNKSKKVLFGDSVAKQLFDNETNNDTINSLACNQSIGMVGQYILLKNYLDAGNRFDTAFFLFQPFSFQNNLDQVYTYHYFLKPFYIKEYLPYFSSTVKEQVAKIPYNKFCCYPSILTSNWAPDFKPKDEKDYTFLSPVSVEYLKKIKELAAKYSFELIVLPTPVSKGFETRVKKFNLQEIADNNFQGEFKNFFEKIIYLDNSEFSDSSHLIDPAPYTEIYRKSFLK